MELEPDRVKAFAQTFINRFDLYPVQLEDGSYVSVKKKLNLGLVAAHLLGSPTLGAYALDADSQAKWICFDADDDRGWRRLLNMASRLARATLTPYLESSRRGGHLWLFTPQIDGSVARQFAGQLLTQYRVGKVEVFPKQNQLKTGPGSLVRLPLGVHRKTGKRYAFITLEKQPLAPTIREQIALLGSPTLVPQAFIDEVVPRAERRAARTRRSPRALRTPEEGLPLSQRLKGAISVPAFVGAYVDLDRSGRGNCPFHDDEHKSFGVKDDYWHCFAGCGGGSIIDFWIKWREMHGEDASFKATLTELADMLL